VTFDLDRFDLRTYLQDRNITFDEEGKNVSSGWWGVNCPFCMDDPSNHLGINTESMGISCWICGTTGTIIKLVMKLDQCSARAAELIINKYSGTQVYPERKKADIGYVKRYFDQISPPADVHFTLTKRIQKYLSKRELPVKTTFEKYKLGWFAPTSFYKYRLYMPVYLNRKLVAFTTRDMTDKMEPPYKNCPDDRCAVAIKDTLYNFDSAVDTAIVVEGPFDVLKVGDGAVGTYGIKYTPAQVKLLKTFKRVFTMYDPEDKAQAQALKIGAEVAGPYTEVENILLDSGDPGDMSWDEVKELRREIFGKIY